MGIGTSFTAPSSRADLAAVKAAQTPEAREIKTLGTACLRKFTCAESALWMDDRGPRLPQEDVRILRQGVGTLSAEKIASEAHIWAIASCLNTGH
jgi:hypothetical protein